MIDLLEHLDGSSPIDPAAQPIARSHGSLPRVAMRGVKDMVRGNFAYIHDLDIQGMWHARVVRPPHVNARLIGIPETARSRLAKNGLKLVEDGSFLAVVGPQEWPVVDQALKLGPVCEWDLGKVCAKLISSTF